jgi:hypothetical protein
VIVVGGFLGLGASYLRPRVYEASSFLQVTVDWNRVNMPDSVTQHQALDRVRVLLLADDTLSEALAMAGSEDAELPDLADLRDSIRLAQTPSGFELLVYDFDPQLAATLANAWATVGVEELSDAILHAIRAADYQDQLYEASCELIPAPEGQQKAIVWSCESSPNNGDTAELPFLILEETKKSKGILPAFSFSITRNAVPSLDPLSWGRSIYILAGFILAALLFVVWSYWSNQKK